MKKRIDVFKRNLHSLIERIKLSESDYTSMKSKAQMYSDMMSTIKYDRNTEYEYIKIELNQYIDNDSPTDDLNLDNIKNI